MQYQSECWNALESVVNISKSFQKVFMQGNRTKFSIKNMFCSTKHQNASKKVV